MDGDGELRGVNYDQIREALEVFIRKGKINGAQKAAKLLRKNLTSEQLEQILEVQIKEGEFFDDIKKIVKLLHRNLTTEELLRMVEIQIKRKWYYKAMYIADFLPEPLRVEKLQFILNRQIEREQLDDAERTIALL